MNPPTILDILLFVMIIVSACLIDKIIMKMEKHKG